jgi:hypothetical protein
MWRAVVSVATKLLPGLLGYAFRDPRVRGRLMPEALARPPISEPCWVLARLAMTADRSQSVMGGER